MNSQKCICINLWKKAHTHTPKVIIQFALPQQKPHTTTKQNVKISQLLLKNYDVYLLLISIYLFFDKPKPVKINKQID